MKIRIMDRFFAVVTALLLLGLTAIVILQAFLGQEWLQRFAAWLCLTDTKGIIIKAGTLLVLIVPALFWLFFAFRRKKQQDGFVRQKTEQGVLCISIDTISGLVTKCVKTHGELALENVGIENDKDGLRITMNITMGDDISIPLAINALQKQLKQYITTATGLEGAEVIVLEDRADMAVSVDTFRMHDLDVQAPAATEKPQEPPVLEDKEEAPAVPVNPEPQEEAVASSSVEESMVAEAKTPEKE